jgi:transcriptional regulator with XRE-family HTH domain
VPSGATVREGTGLSQSRFAEVLGVSVRTLQEWEQGRRAPSGAARALLLIAAKNPRAPREQITRRTLRARRSENRRTPRQAAQPREGLLRNRPSGPDWFDAYMRLQSRIRSA